MIWIGGHIDTLKADDPRYAGFKPGSRGCMAQRPLTTLLRHSERPLSAGQPRDVRLQILSRLDSCGERGRRVRLLELNTTALQAMQLWHGIHWPCLRSGAWLSQWEPYPQPSACEPHQQER